MENQHSSAAPPNAAKGGSGPSGSTENKDVATTNLSSAAEATDTVATTDDVSDKGKSVAADDDIELKPHVVAERKRRTRMRDYYDELKTLIPQIPKKCDKGTIVGHAIDYIQFLQKTKAELEKRKQELELARQAGAEVVASSSSAPPQSAQGMALEAMSSDVVPDACSAVGPLQPVPAPQLLPATMSSDVPQPPLAAAAEAAPPPAEHRITAVPVGFQTWSWPDLLLSVSNDNAYINVCSPRHRGMWTMRMVLSVLNKHGIEVVTAQVDSDALRTVLNIYARVTAMVGGNNPSALEVYQLAVSEILVWLTTS